MSDVETQVESLAAGSAEPFVEARLADLVPSGGVALVVAGEVDVFILRAGGGATAAARHHLGSFGTGAALWAPPPGPCELMAVGVGAARVAIVTHEELGSTPAASEHLGAAMAAWRGALATAAGLAAPPPHGSDGAGHGGLDGWSTAMAAALDEADERDRSRRERRVALDDERWGRVLAEMVDTARLQGLDEVEHDPDLHPLVAAVGEIGRLEGFEVSVPEGGLDPTDPIGSLGRHSGFRHRRVRLQGEWWCQGSGPLLAFRRPPTADRPRPVALVPDRRGHRLRCWDPIDDTTVDIDSEVADSFLPDAIEVGAPLQAVGGLGVGQVVRFALRGGRRDLLLILGCGLAAGLLGLVAPILVGYVLGTVVPAGEVGLLAVAGLGLAVVAVLIGLLGIVQGFAVGRVGQRAQARLGTAVWDRVLSLPASFFGRFTSGELANRVLAVDQLTQVFSTTNVAVVSGAAFSVVNLVLLATYDLVLGLVAGVGLGAVVAGTWRSARRIVESSDDIATHDRATRAHLAQIIDGLPKIRGAGAEARFRARHLGEVRSLVAAQDRQQLVAARLAAFYGAVPAVLTASVIAVIGLRGGADGRIDVSTYVAFTAALGAVVATLMSLSLLIGPVATAVPVLAAMQPIFAQAPESAEGSLPPGRLEGHIRFRDVSFNYPGGPPILRGLDLEIEAGELVALVGPSGSGKSTILRLVLGFERPTSGIVSIDDQDLTGVDLAAVRHQFGVVMQQGQVRGGSILDNVIGARSLGPDDAWAALEAAGLADDVREMPMGLHTVVDSAGAALSGGQIQRLLIARALVTRPAVLLMDEATSALDDLTQATVTRSIGALGVTRIVVAHRLSTIRHADRIVVVDGGRAVETGTYDELIDAGGLFADLARRQIA